MKSELKIKALSPEEIAQAVGGRLVVFGNGAEKVTSITYDSRDVTEGSLFCAVKGERTDGHLYIGDVVKKGAACVLVNKEPTDIQGDFTAVVTDDTVKALGLLSGYYRSLSKAVVIGVTGSVGKTTTKDFIAAVTSESFVTLKTEGNHNNEIGLPMTLFSLTPECRVAVVEMGMSAKGEISFMTKLARPKIGVITNVGTSHIGSLGSRENIRDAKLEIAEGIPEEGVLFINGDDPLLAAEHYEFAFSVERYGVHSRSAAYKAMNIRTGADNTVFDIVYSNTAVINVEIPTLGRHNVYNALVAFAIGTMLGMDERRIRNGLKNFKSTGMRQKIYEMNGITVIEDCYNAAPESMRAAIEVLTSKAKKTGGTPCALLGDMLELGEGTRLMHDQLGQLAAQMKIKKLYCYGAMAETVAEAAIKKGIRAENVYVCSDISRPDIMAGMMNASLESGDVLLVKASRGVAAERVIGEMKKLQGSSTRRKS